MLVPRGSGVDAERLQHDPEKRAGVRSDLKEAVEGLYAAFAAYPLRKPVDGCDCCVWAEDVAVLCSVPLRQLPADALYRIATSLVLTWGDVAEVKYLLPRLLEVALTERGWVDWEVLLACPRRAGWHRWTDAEQTALRRYLRSLWRAALETPPSDEDSIVPDVDRGLCAIAQAEEDLSWYLRQWALDRSDAALENLCHFLADNARPLRRRGRPDDAFWRDRELQAARVVDWLRRPALAEMLLAEFERREPTPLGASLAAAIDHLATLAVPDDAPLRT
jgi:hypothetical protein